MEKMPYRDGQVLVDVHAALGGPRGGATTTRLAAVAAGADRDRW